MLRCLRSSSSAPEAELPGGAEAAADRKPSEKKLFIFSIAPAASQKKKRIAFLSLFCSRRRRPRLWETSLSPLETKNSVESRARRSQRTRPR